MLLIKISVIVFITLTFSCCIENINNEDVLIVYDEEEYMKLVGGNDNLKIKVVDTHCINGRKRAQEDLKKGNLKFYDSEFDYGFSEKQRFLSNHGVKLESFYFPDVLYNDKFEYGCYQKEMMEGVALRMGVKYIDSILIEAERSFAQKNPDSAFQRDGEDIRKKYLSN